ncbi:unnamed protein product [Allacma fusca]|uniref:Uncharacterized protein n=1 Tax=Allacma fusca TaxID=39272 RepID=A0A8J2K0F4_9HEXA|nr:unnamed protein product [Allacma fusca]
MTSKSGSKLYPREVFFPILPAINSMEIDLNKASASNTIQFSSQISGREEYVMSSVGKGICAEGALEPWFKLFKFKRPDLVRVMMHCTQLTSIYRIRCFPIWCFGYLSRRKFNRPQKLAHWANGPKFSHEWIKSTP